MPRLFLPTLVLGLLCGGCAQVAGPAARGPVKWAHEGSDLKPDPSVVWGRLDNGLRYAIKPHPTPVGRVSVHLLVPTGFVHEREGEGGYAHFVEHMAFRGSRGFPGESVISTLQALGLEFGPHVNAHTGLFETAYHFDHLPTDNTAALPTGLRILRAMADGIEFDPRVIAVERGVIAGERRSRDAMMARVMPDEQEFLPPREATLTGAEFGAFFSDNWLKDRSPAKDEKAEQSATAERLRAFYSRWYRPERMIVTVAGDVATAEAERLVRETFATLAARGRAPAEPKPAVPPREGTFVHAAVQPAESATAISIGMARARTAPDGAARRRQLLVDRMALAMMERRFERTASGAEAPFDNGEAFQSHIVPGLELALLRATARPLQWPKALGAVNYELRRVLEQGFAPTELSRVVKAEGLRLAAAARQAENVSSVQLAQTLGYSIARGVVFTAPDDDRRLADAQLGTLTVQECQEAVRAMLTGRRYAIALAGPWGEGVPEQRALEPALDESRARELTRYEPPPPPRPFPYTNFGPPGEVVSNEHSAALDAELVRFRNGVRLNLKRTRFEPGQVRVLVRVEGGRLANPPDKPGLDLRMLSWLYGGLLNLTDEEKSDALAELERGVSYSVSGEDFKISQRVDAVHLPLFLQAVTALFVHPAFRPEADERALDAARQITARYRSTAVGLAEVTVQQRMLREHPYVRLSDIGDVARRTPAELREWLVPELAFAPLEISVVGDFEPTEAIDAVARTYGALPARRATALPDRVRQVEFPSKPFAETMNFDGAQGLAVVALAWPAATDLPYRERFRGAILAAILRERLRQKVRLEMGETYSVGAGFESHDVLKPQPSFLSCTVEAVPDRTERVLAAAREVAAKLARDGATPEELERVRQPYLRSVEAGLRNNEWLLDEISVAQSNPPYAEGWARAWDEYQATTLAEINALAQRVIVKERESQLIVKPK